MHVYCGLGLLTFGADGGFHGGSLWAVGTPWAKQAGVSPRKWAESARFTGKFQVGPCRTVEARGTPISMDSI